ncbi:MAG: glutathione S-transferase family protein [Motiliproteus sp.]
MKLYGIAVSNYYNIVKLALLEKRLPFDEIQIPPSQDKTVLAYSPMGKIPYLQHGNLFISESQAILFYLELLHPRPRLYPTEAERGARAQQVHQFIDLYIDDPVRTLLAAAFFNAEYEQSHVDQVSEQLAHNFRALSQITDFGPFIAGEQLSHADLAAFMTFNMCQAIMAKLSNHDPLAPLSGVGAFMDMMAQRPSCQQVIHDQQSAFVALSQKLK